MKESCEDTVTSDAVSTENISNISKKRDLSKDEKKILRKSKKYRQAEAAQVEEYKDFVHGLFKRIPLFYEVVLSVFATFR